MAEKTVTKAHRCFKLKHDGNEHKLQQIRDVLPHYQKLCRSIQHKQYIEFLHGLGFSSMQDTKDISTLLSQRYCKSGVTQVYESMSSWMEITKEEFKKVITASSLTPHDKQIMYRINKRGQWFAPCLDLPTLDTEGKHTGGRTRVRQRHLRLARVIVKYIKKRRNRLPDVSKSRTMKLDAAVAVLEPSKDSDEFDYWLRVSTLTPNKPVRIPLKSNKYVERKFDKEDLSWTRMVQIQVDENTGSVHFKPIAVKSVAKTRVEPVKKSKGSAKLNKPVAQFSETKDTTVLALDWGMNNMFTTSDGHLLGKRFLQWLTKIDKQLIKLQSELQKQGRKLKSSRRYIKLQARIKEHVKNEVNRIFNRLVKVKNPDLLVLEKLDFRSSNMSRTLNRLLTRFSRSVVKKKLRVLREDLGIEHILVPAAYSSRECSRCHYTAKANRKTQSLFKCQYCGLTMHADVNASRTIRSRRSWPKNMMVWGKNRILLFLQDEFKDLHGLDSYPVKIGSTEETLESVPRHKENVSYAPTGALVAGKRVMRFLVQSN